jgi:hypothetical protein
VVTDALTVNNQYHLKGNKPMKIIKTLKEKKLSPYKNSSMQINISLKLTSIKNQFQIQLTFKNVVQYYYIPSTKKQALSFFDNMDFDTNIVKNFIDFLIRNHPNDNKICAKLGCLPSKNTKTEIITGIKYITAPCTRCNKTIIIKSIPSLKALLRELNGE